MHHYIDDTGKPRTKDLTRHAKTPRGISCGLNVCSVTLSGGVARMQAKMNTRYGYTPVKDRARYCLNNSFTEPSRNYKGNNNNDRRKRNSCKNGYCASGNSDHREGIQGPANGLCFRSGPANPGNTHHDATTGGSRTMDAKPRMPTRQNLSRHSCSASGWNQTGTTHQTRNGAPRIKWPRPKSPEQRQPPRWKGARPNSPASKEKRPALPTHQVTIRIGTTHRQAPLRTTHGTTPPVAGIQSQEPDAQTNSSSPRNTARSNDFAFQRRPKQPPKTPNRMPQQAPAVKWLRSHGWRLTGTFRLTKPSAANACYAALCALEYDL